MAFTDLEKSVIRQVFEQGGDRQQSLDTIAELKKKFPQKFQDAKNAQAKQIQEERKGLRQEKEEEQQLKQEKIERGTELTPVKSFVERGGKLRLPTEEEEELAQAPVEPEDIRAVAELNKPEFFERLGDIIQERGVKGGEIISAGVKEEQTAAESGVQFGLNFVGALAELIGEGVVTGLATITPEELQEQLKKGVQEVAKTKGGQFALSKLEEAQKNLADLNELNPRVARNFEGFGDAVSGALTFAGGVGAKEVVTKTGKEIAKVPTKLKQVGAVIEKAGAKRIAQKQLKEAEELFTPLKTEKQRRVDIEAGQIQETPSKLGIFGGKQIRVPTKIEKEIIEELTKVEGISPSNTLLKNRNLTIEKIGKLADELDTSLKQRDVLIPKKETKAMAKEVRASLDDNPLILQASKKQIDNLFKAFERFVDDNSGKGSGLLQARKDLDGWLKQIGKEKVLDPQTKNVLSVAVSDLRRGANALLDTKAVSTPVKELLRRQSNLFRATDNIGAKAVKEAETKFSRLTKRLKKVTGLKASTVAALSALGLGGTGFFFPALVLGGLGVGGGLLGAGALIKAAISPKSLELLGKALKEVDALLVKSPQNKALLSAKAELTDILGKENGLGILDTPIKKSLKERLLELGQ